MSSEETEQEYRNWNRELIKVPVEWIHPNLSDLFAVVDTYQPAREDATFNKGRGNRPHQPPSATKRPGRMAPPLTGLPKNWYHETWLKAQSPTALTLLKVVPPHHLPCLVGVYRSGFPVILLTVTPRNPITELEALYDVIFHTYFETMFYLNSVIG